MLAQGDVAAVAGSVGYTHVATSVGVGATFSVSLLLPAAVVIPAAGVLVVVFLLPADLMDASKQEGEEQYFDTAHHF